MTTQERLEAFVQSVYLVRYNRYIDDIQDDDGQDEIRKTIDFTNQLVEEIELETDWQFARENDYTLGTIGSPVDTFQLEDEVRKLVVNEHRPLVIMQGDTVVSKWDVVDPTLITNSRGADAYAQRVTVVDNTVVFSRPFTDYEIGGTVKGDVIMFFPLLSEINVDLLDFVKPKQLLILGGAKNATLPDIVQGGLSPSYVQKYNDLLEKAVAENEASAVAADIIRDDYGYITGVY